MAQTPDTAAVTADDAFRELSVRHVQAAYKLAWAILGDDADAEDATQDAFAAAWRQRASLRDPLRFDAWFGRILVNTCRDRIRRRVVRRRLPEPPRAPDDSIGAISRRDELERALRRLDDEQRIVVILRFWADLTVDEIAARLDVPSGTVKSRLHRAMHNLRDVLGAE